MNEPALENIGVIVSLSTALIGFTKYIINKTASHEIKENEVIMRFYYYLTEESMNNDFILVTSIASNILSIFLALYSVLSATKGSLKNLISDYQYLYSLFQFFVLLGFLAICIYLFFVFCSKKTIQIKSEIETSTFILYIGLALSGLTISLLGFVSRSTFLALPIGMLFILFILYNAILNIQCKRKSKAIKDMNLDLNILLSDGSMIKFNTAQLEFYGEILKVSNSSCIYKNLGEKINTILKTELGDSYSQEISNEIYDCIENCLIRYNLVNQKNKTIMIDSNEILKIEYS